MSLSCQSLRAVKSLGTCRCMFLLRRMGAERGGGGNLCNLSFHICRSVCDTPGTAPAAATVAASM